MQALALVGILIVANVVAAGWVFVIGLMLEAYGLGFSSPWVWMAVLGTATVVSLCFFRGALFYITRLQWPPSRRGG